MSIKKIYSCLINNQLLKREIRLSPYMTTSQKNFRKISLEMKSEVHYKQVADFYRKSEQYINMINLYPVLQTTLIDCKNENLIE